MNATTVEEPQDVFAASRVFRFAITGTAPLILERFQGFEQTEGHVETLESHIHRTEDGICIPSTCFRWSLLNGTRGRKIRMMAAANVVKSAVFTTPQRQCILLDPATGIPLSEFKAHDRIITKGRGKNKVSETKRNPRFDAWKTFVEFEIDLAFVSASVITSLFLAAGKTCGIGVECANDNGEFGTYTVELVDDLGKVDEDRQGDPR